MNFELRLGMTALFSVVLTLPCFADALDDGEKLFNQNKFVEAYQCFNKAVTANPKDPFAYNERGMALTRMERYSEALPDFQKAITLKPNLEIAYGEQAKAYFGLHKYQDAVASASRAIQLDTLRQFDSTGDAYYVRANCYLELNQLTDAERDSKECEKYEEKATDAISLELKIAEKKNDREAQIAAWNRLIAANPNEVRYYGNRGSVYWNMGQYDKGLADMEFCSQKLHAAGREKEAAGLDSSIETARKFLNNHR